MKQFFKFLLASVLGSCLSVIVGSFFLFLILMGMVASITNFEKDEIENVNPNSVLEIKLNYAVPDRTINDLQFGDLLDIESYHVPIGLNDILKNIKKASFDENIDGIFLNLNNINETSLTIVDEIRTALIEFKTFDKFIVAHGDVISQKAFYLSSIADEVYLTPSGSIDFKGLSAELMFFKKTLEKLEIEPQVFVFGKYKSAIEPFTRSNMSSQNREQTSVLLNDLSDYFIKNISLARNISVDSLKLISNKMLARTPLEAVEHRLIDGLLYREDVKDLIGKKVLSGDDSYYLVSNLEYLRVPAASKKSTSNRIAVIYAQGEINTSSGNEENIGISNIVNALIKARNNSRVRAIVLRVNSPGGAVLTSDIIWNEVKETTEYVPVIVSMGPLAASGGYYISCPADYIVTDPTTITGSIGVFGIIPNTESFFENKLGITFDRVKTGEYSDYISVTRKVSKQERALIQKEIDNIYTSFVEKVATGRNLEKDYVHKYAQGRVWTGQQAVEIGLADTLGGLTDAIAIAADRADIEFYKILEYPKKKDPFQIIQDILSTQSSTSLLKSELGENYKYYKQFEIIIKLKGVQARIPFELEIN